MAYKVERILALLEKVKSRGHNKWIACCPAHDDKEPSLTIEETHDKILMFCWSGCNTYDVLSALGLQWEDLYFAEKGAKLEGFRTIKEEEKPHKFQITIDFYKRKIKTGQKLNKRELRLLEFCIEQLENA